MKSGTGKSFSTEEIKRLAQGRVLDILQTVAGIPSEYLDGKHHPCPDPNCGGDNRFRFDQAKEFIYCNQCFNKKNSDFLAAIQHFRGVPLPEAVRLVADYLGVRPEGKRSGATATDAKPNASSGTGDKGEPKIDIREPAATYRYTDEKGTTLFEVLRYVGTYADGSTEKTFRQRRPDPNKKGAWIWKGVNSIRQVPYMLPRVLSAEFVFVVEGEKDADRLNAILRKAGTGAGAVATTSARGAKNSSPWPGFAKEFKLYEKKICVIPDNDAAGLSFGRSVCRAVVRSNAFYDPAKEKEPPLPDVRLIVLPDLPEKGDVSDWIDRMESEGKTPKEIVEALGNLCKAAPAITDEIVKEWDREEVAIPAKGENVAGASESKPAIQWEPFPVEVLPDTLRKYSVESAAACDIDPAFVAPFVVAAVASTVGSAFRVRIKKGWFEPPILWTALVVGSGSGKSPGLDAAVDPLRTLQRAADDDYREAVKLFESDWLSYEADLSIWKTDRRKAEHASKEPPARPDPPVPQTFVVDDTTTEAAAEILVQNPFGILMEKDELAGWIGCFNAYRTGGDKDSPFWLSIHGGRSHRINRKTGNRIIAPRTPAVSICGGIQPGILRKVFEENEHFFDNGLAARILFAMPPDKSARWTEAEVADETKERYVEVLKTILGWRNGPNALTPEQPQIVGMTEAAKKLFAAYCNENADERDDMASEAMRSFWPKLTGYAARIALVFHVVRYIEGGAGEQPRIDADSMRSAITLTNWFKRESVRIVQLIRGEACSVDFDAKAILAAIRKNGGEITVRELQRRVKDYGKEGGADRAERKLREMVTAKTLAVRMEQAEKGGRPKEVFRIIEPNPVDTTPDSVDTTPPKNTPKVDTTPLFPEENGGCVDCQPSEFPKNEFSDWDPDGPATDSPVPTRGKGPKRRRASTLTEADR